MTDQKFFFSYAREDSEFVLKLATDLRARGTSLWLDQLDIIGGQRWDHAVERALGTCQGLIACLSPESLASNNVMDEVSYALEEGKLVIPIRLRPCVIPFRLRRLQHVDFAGTDYDAALAQLVTALKAEPQAAQAMAAPVAGAARDVSNTPATGDRAPGSVHTEVPPTHRGGRPGIFSPPVFMGAGALLASLFFVVYLNSRSAPDDPSPDPTSPIVQPHPNPPPEGDPVKPPPSNPPSGRGRQEKGGASPQPPRLEEPTEPTRDGNSDRPTASAFAPGTWSGTLTFAGTASRIGVEFCQDASMRLSSRLGDRAFGKWLASANNMVSIDARHRDLGPFTCELALSGSSLEGPCEASGRSAGTITLSPDPGRPGTPSAAGIPLNGTVCEQRSFLEAPKPPAESPDQMRNRWEAFLRSIRN